MPLNVSKGNMYSFVSHTWNTVKGQCEHDCDYCYMKVFKLGPQRFDKSELKTDLGHGNFIFVGSSNDLFAESVPGDWIKQTLEHCIDFPQNRYLFQSKNPKRFSDFMIYFPEKSIFGTTIETNREYNVSKAPSPYDRAHEMDFLSKNGYKVMITIEPIMKFDLEVLLFWINAIKPQWINIGSDSKGHHLPEPTKEEIAELIEKLRNRFTVVQKKNLRRLLGGER